MDDANDHPLVTITQSAIPAVVTPVPLIRLPKRIGKSPAENLAPVSHSPTASKAFSFSKFSKNKRKTPKFPSEVPSILGGMYAHPPPPHSPSNAGPSKTPFIYRKVARPLNNEAESSQSSSATDASTNIRARTLSDNSIFTSVAEQTLQSIANLHVEPLQQSTASTSTTSTSSLESSSPSGRLVGRGGSGSRPRVIAPKNIVIPRLQSLDAIATSNSPHVALRPSGRGGLASRPQQLAPPPPPPKSPHALTEIQAQGTTAVSVAVSPAPASPAPTFIRPGGRGGLGAHAHANSPPLTLRDILNRKKQKSEKKQQKGRLRAITTSKPPTSSSLAYEITNASSETVSTIHFVGECTSPPLSFFHERQRNLQSASADDLSTIATPPFSATASTFEESLSPETEDDMDISVHMDGAPHMSPEDLQRRRINKLTRTFGDNPYDQTTGALTQTVLPVDNQSFPKVITDRAAAQKGKTTKKFRRASISVSSLFGHPLRIRDSDGLDSQSTIDTISDDLLGDDNKSEPWGAVDTSRLSAYGAPQSPIVFSLPSPPLLPQTEAKSNSPQSVHSLESDKGSFVPSPTLSRSQTYTSSSQRESAQIGHNHSLSTSLSGHAFSENSSTTSSVNWLIPPSSDDRDLKLLVTSKRNVDKPLSWTGEWNTDMHDVIRALRELR